VLLALLAAESTGTGDRAALYGAVALVLTSLIGGGFAYLTSRSKADPPSVRYLDPPTSNALPQALSELWELAIEERLAAEHMAEIWKQRAVDAGWQEELT
jgi:hypothetical protein